MYPMLYKIINQDLPSIKIKSKEISSFLACLKARIELRFDYVVNDKSNTKGLFLAATFMYFHFKKI